MCTIARQKYNLTTTATTGISPNAYSFLAQKESLNEDESEKLQWLRKKIDWLDPFIEYNDELLSEEDKKSIIHPESADEKRAAYHSYLEIPLEFSFWNNPFRRRS